MLNPSVLKIQALLIQTETLWYELKPSHAKRVTKAYPVDAAEYLAAAFEMGQVNDVTHALATIARARGMSYTA